MEPLFIIDDDERVGLWTTGRVGSVKGRGKNKGVAGTRTTRGGTHIRELNKAGTRIIERRLTRTERTQQKKESKTNKAASDKRAKAKRAKKAKRSKAAKTSAAKRRRKK